MAGKKKSTGGNGKYHDLALTLTSVLVICGVLLLQITARKLKKWTESKHHASDVLEASERELTILGVIAFGLFVLEEVSADAKGEWYDVFHEVHFALFTVAVFFIGLNVMLYKMSRRFGQIWKAHEADDLENHKALVARSHRLRRKLKLKPLDSHSFFGTFWVSGLLTDPFAWFEYQHVLEAMSFHEIRRDFLRSQHLPHEFQFAPYLESCLQHVCLEFAEIRDSVWVLGVLGLVVHLYVSTLTTRPEVADVLVWLSIGACVLALVVFLKVKWVYWYILHSEVVYRGGDDATTIQPGLFWFGNPGLVVTLLELCLFVVATTFSVLLFNTEGLRKKNELWGPSISLAVSGVLLVVLFPRILPRFTLVTHVGEMTDPRRLAEAVTKQQTRGRLGYEKAIQSSRRNHHKSSLRRALSRASSSSAGLGLNTIATSIRRRFKSLTWGGFGRAAWESIVVAPAISTLSALLAIAYVFAIAVTLDPAAARSVVGNGSVVAVRGVELALIGLFVIEASTRLAYDPRSTSRQLDVLNVYFCASLTVAQHILLNATADPSDSARRTAAVLHAASATIILRVFNTAWHRELVKPRFEHIRLSPEELLEHGSHGHGSHGGGSGHGHSGHGSSGHHAAAAKEGASGTGGATSEMTATKTAAGRPVLGAARVFGSKTNLLALANEEASNADDDDGRPVQVVADGDAPDGVEERKESSDTPSADGLARGIVQRVASVRSIATTGQPGPASHQPAWLAFYAPPATTAVVKSDARGEAVKRAEALVHDLLLAAFDELPDGAVEDAAPATVAKAALQASLALVDDDENENGDDDDDGRDAKHAKTRAMTTTTTSQTTTTTPQKAAVVEIAAIPGVTSTANEELEDSLYFNHVLAHGLATVSVGKKRQSWLGVFIGAHAEHDSAADHNAEVAALDAKVVLTRDQILYYAADATLSERLDGGEVRQVAAKTAEPKTVAVDAPGCVPPEGRLHLSTLLKVEVAHGPKDNDATKATFVCTTTAHVFRFVFKSAAEAARWKAAVEDAVDREDDDDPIHPGADLDEDAAAGNGDEFYDADAAAPVTIDDDDDDAANAAEDVV